MNHHNNNVPDNLNSHLNPNIPTFLITVIGMGGSGKTSYITRFLTGEFRDKYVATVGCERTTILFYTNYGPISLNLSEPSGALRYTYLEIINGCGNIPTVMVGNKIDLPDEKRKLKVDKVLYHRKIGTPFYTISVKKMINLEKPLLYLISQLIGRNDVKFVEDPAVPPPMVESSMRTEENLREMEQLAEAGAQVPLPYQDDDEIEAEAREPDF